MLLLSRRVIYEEEECVEYRKIQCAYDEIKVIQAEQVIYYITGDMEPLKHANAILIKLKKTGTEMYGYKLPINGEDVMRERNIPAGKEVGTWMNEALMYAYRNPKVTRGELLKIVKNGLVYHIKG